jgi:HAMP domain-containing protein
MDIRTKLVFTLVAVSLGSMAALGVIAYSTSGDLLEDISVRQLEALAASKKQDLEQIVQAWQDRVYLIASRTQLRISLDQHNAEHADADRDVIRRILEDARRSVRRVRSLSVYDVHGHLVSSTDEDPGLAVDSLPDARVEAARGATPEYEGLFDTSGRTPEIRFLSALELADHSIGWLEVRLNAGEVADITGNFTGLGETGEVLIVAPEGSGRLRILHPTRHSSGMTRSTYAANPEDPAFRAASGEEGVFLNGATDYRGNSVWAATQFLPVLGWGVVVKLDAAEERRPARELGSRLMRSALALSAFAVLAGVLLGFWFARPIHELAGVADRIRAGERGLRAEVSSHDEVGDLARTFNQMADALTNPGIRIEDVEREVERLRKNVPPSSEAGDTPTGPNGSTGADPD